MLDAQTRVEDTTALAALVQCLVRLPTDPLSPVAPAASPRMLEDSRLLAARDGMDAAPAVDRTGTVRHVRLTLEHLADACMAVAGELGCVNELIHATSLMAAPGARRQRAAFSRRHGRRSARLRTLVATLHGEFTGIDERRPDRRMAA